MWNLELREVYESGEIENPDLQEYYWRLYDAGLFEFDKKRKKKDNNTVGHCWYRAHAARLGVFCPW